MDITNHRLVGVPFVKANSFGGAMGQPTLIVLHDTAGRLEKGNCVAWFRAKSCKTSAHLVIDRDGTVTQMVPFNMKAFHAGKSYWDGRNFCNAFSIGIEIVNPGKLDAKGRAWFHKDGEPGFPGAALEYRKTKEHGDGWWLPYTDEQITAVKHVCRALMEEYADCNQIVTHWHISPGRKVDTCPLMPLEDVRAYAMGFDDDTDEDKEPSIPVVSTPAPPKTIAHSTEAQAAVATGGSGGALLFAQMQTAAKSAKSDGSFDLSEFLWTLITDPVFVPALLVVVTGAYLFFKRRARYYTQGS